MDIKMEDETTTAFKDSFISLCEDSSLLNYVSFERLNGENSQGDLLPENAKLCAQLQIQRERYIRRTISQNTWEENVTLLLPQTIAKYKFCFNKKTKYRNIYNDKKKILNEEISQKISKFQCVVAIANSKNLIVNISITNFLKDEKKKFRKCHMIKKLVFRMKSLEKHISSILFEKETILSNQYIQKILQISTDSLDPSSEYSGYQKLDDICYYLIYENNIQQSFVEYSKDLTKSSNKTIIKRFEQMVKLITSFFRNKDSLTTAEKKVIHNSMNRLVFGQAYTISFRRLFNVNHSIEEYKNFQKNCELIIAETPKSMNINKMLIRPNEYEKPFIDIIKNYDELIAAVNHLYIIQFQFCPIDIVANVLKAMEYIEIFVLVHVSNENVKKHKITKRAGLMSFDDIFALFCPVFAYKPPINCEKVAQFLRETVEFTASGQFQFAREILLSVIEFIQNYEPITQS